MKYVQISAIVIAFAIRPCDASNAIANVEDNTPLTNLAVQANDDKLVAGYEFEVKVNPSAAVMIQQGVGDSHIAFEAEIGDLVDADGNGILWRPVDDSMTPDSPSGGLALLTPLADEYAADNPGFGSPLTAHPGGTADYRLNFASSGDYYFYIRAAYQDQEGGSDARDEDSFYAPADFGGSPDFLKQNRFNPLSTNTWHWHNVSSRLSCGWEGFVIGPYSVMNPDLGRIQQFAIGSREGGFIIDRIVLSTSASLTAVQLDALPNSRVIPEPSTFTLCCLFGLVCGGIGHRHRTSTRLGIGGNRDSCFRGSPLASS